MQRELTVLDFNGESKHQWNPDNPDEVAAIRTLYNELKKKGFLAFSVNRKGDRGEQIREFDPEAGHIILAPPQKGG